MPPAATPDLLARLTAVIEAGQPAALAELAALCAIPSVSAKQQGQEPCAQLVAEQMRRHGLDAEVQPTPDGGPPVVFGQARADRDDAPTVLFYNHYDVQPAEPLDLWDSDPFTFTVRENKAYARGVADDKGHITSRCLPSMPRAKPTAARFRSTSSL